MKGTHHEGKSYFNIGLTQLNIPTNVLKVNIKSLLIKIMSNGKIERVINKGEEREIMQRVLICCYCFVEAWSLFKQNVF